MSHSLSLARRVFSGSGKISVANGLARVVALLCFPLLSRWLGPEPYGVYTLAATVVGLSSTLGLLGLDMAYARYYLDSKSQQKLVVEAFCWTRSAAASGLCAVLATALWLVFSQRFAPFDRTSVALFLPVAILLSVMATMATTRVRLLAQYGRMASAVAVAGAASAFVSLVLAAVGLHGVLPLLLGALTTSALSLIWLGLPPLRGLCRSASRLRRSKRRELLKLGLSCAVTGPLYWLISSSDRWFLALSFGEADLGIYSIASTLALSGIMVNSAVHLSLFPEASRLVAEGSSDHSFRLARLWEQLAVVLLVVMLLVGSLGGPLLRLLTAPSFHTGTSYIPWLACGAFFYGLAGLGNLPFFLVGKMNQVAIYWGFAAACCLILNSFLIPHFGGLGAAIAQMLTFLALSLLTLAAGRSLMPLPLRWARLCLAVALGLAGLAGTSVLSMANPWLELIRNLIAMGVFGLGLVWLVSPVALGRLFLQLRRG